MSKSNKVHLLSSETLATYKNHSDSWERSGINQLEYCKRHNLSYNTFSYVRNKLGLTKTAKATIKPHHNFIPLKPIKRIAEKIDGSETPLINKERIILHIKQGKFLELPPTLNQEQLLNIFIALGLAS